jgi:hypothetical protein
MADIFQALSNYANNASGNLVDTFSRMTLEKWIRIVVIIGAYALLRPYLMKLGAWSQLRQHEKEAEATGAEAVAKAQMSPNQLRGIAEIPDDTDDEADVSNATAQTSAADWGKKARRRQREVLKKMIDAEEERLRQAQEDDEDKDIEEFLVPE